MGSMQQPYTDAVQLPQQAREWIKKQLLARLAEQLLLQLAQEEAQQSPIAICCGSSAIRPARKTQCQSL